MITPRLKFAVTVVAGQSPSSSDVSDLDTGQPFLQGKAEFGPVHPTPRYECSVANKECQPGDILVSVRAPVGAINIADQKYGIGRGLAAVRAQSIDAGFLRWILEAAEARLRSEANGSTFEAITAWNVGEVPFSETKPVAQRAIAHYLDHETGEINAMIAKMDELAETLKARRLAAIDGAFADLRQPVDAAFQMVADVTVGIVIEPSKLYVHGGDGVPALRGLNVTPGRIVKKDIVQISVEGHQANLKSELREGDLVTVRTGQVGVTAIVPPEWDGANAIDLVITRPRPGVSSTYLYWFLCSSISRNQMDTETVGAVQAHFNVSALKRLRTPMIDESEQQRIADHLDEVTGKIDTMLAKVAELKSLLIERRAALITDVVTGRKAVA